MITRPTGSKILAISQSKLTANVQSDLQISGSVLLHNLGDGAVQFEIDGDVDTSSPTLNPGEYFPFLIKVESKIAVKSDTTPTVEAIQMG